MDSVKNMASDFARDIHEVQEQKERYDNVNRDIDKATSDKVITGVMQEYKNNTIKAKDEISAALKENWLFNAHELRAKLSEIITET